MEIWKKIELKGQKNAAGGYIFMYPRKEVKPCQR